MVLDRAVAWGRGGGAGELGGREQVERGLKGQEWREVASTCATWGDRTRSRMELGTSVEAWAALGSGRGWRVMGGEGRGLFFPSTKKSCCCFNYLKYRDVKVKLSPFLWF